MFVNCLALAQRFVVLPTAATVSGFRPPDAHLLTAFVVFGLFVVWLVLFVRMLQNRFALQVGTRTVLQTVTRARAQAVLTGQSVELRCEHGTPGARLQWQAQDACMVTVPLPRRLAVQFLQQTQPVDRIVFDADGQASAERIRMRAGHVTVSIPAADPPESARIAAAMAVPTP